MSVPINLTVLYQKCAVKDGVEKFPFINILPRQPAVIAKGAGRGPSLYHLVTLPAKKILFSPPKDITAVLIQIEQLIGIHIADIDISRILFHHELKILFLLIFRGDHVINVDSRQAEHRHAGDEVIGGSCRYADPAEAAAFDRHPAGHRSFSITAFMQVPQLISQ